MQQQINLYQLIPGRQKLDFNSKQFIIGCSIFILILLLNTLFAIWQKHKSQTMLTELTTKSSEAKQELLKLMVKYPALNPQDLDASMNKLQEEIDAKTKMMLLLSQGIGFSKNLTALAAASVPGLWLSEILISEGGTNISLQGQARESAAIQLFLTALAQQPAFINNSLKLQSMTKTNESPYLNFLIATKAK